MQIIEHKSIFGTEQRLGYIGIPELHRYKPSAQQFIKLADLCITLTKRTAFIYVDGFTTSQAESGINLPSNSMYVPALKSGSSYLMHEWISTFKNKEHLVSVNIVSSTCASGIQALYDAHKLLYSGVVDEVIIIGGERNTEDTARLFKELMININCGDGFVYLKLGKDGVGDFTTISNILWKYKYEVNPFYFTTETINLLTPDYEVDFVKLHGTGTKSNTLAEKDIAKLGIPLIYKNKIGHTQGISSLVESCMVIDDESIKGKILVVANGVGGFFGSFTITK